MFVCLLIAVVVSSIVQGGLVLGFVLCLRNFRRPLLLDSDCPRATVILCLRGGDPFLSRCLDGIRNLNYPNFDVLLVVDSRNDPSLLIVEPLLAQGWKNASILYLEERLATCSLKCSSLITAIKQVREDTNFVALIDADTVPHSGWLRELATALHEEKIGAATGNRWYMPHEASKGAWIRHVWNAAAIVQMYWYGIAWGGTLAIKMEAIRQAKLIDKWSRALCEDTMLKKQLSQVGLKVKFAPSLMMINRENCSVSNFYAWVKRQLLTAKLYHPLWWAVVGHGFSSAALLLLGWLSVGYCFVTGRWLEGGQFALLMGLFHLYLSLLIPIMELFVSRIAEDRGESGRWEGKWSVLSLCVAVWETQWVYTSALLACLSMRRVEWRGVEYTIDAPFDIRMDNDRPFILTEGEPQSTESL